MRRKVLAASGSLAFLHREFARTSRPDSFTQIRGTGLAAPAVLPASPQTHHMLINPSRGESAHAPLQSRRVALGTLGAGALALLGSTASASALFSKKPRISIFTPSAPVDFSDLPQEWVARQGSELKAYADFLGSLRLQQLTPRQVIQSHAKQRGSVWNSLPPRDMWRQMAPTLRVIDRLSKQLGHPVRDIVSAYRAPAYNARCPGAKSGSYHQANVAVDVQFPVAPSVVAQTARSLRSSGVFSGGVGRYPTFTHIDTRGQNADW
jgi:hypothetical protein